MVVLPLWNILCQNMMNSIAVLDDGNWNPHSQYELHNQDYWKNKAKLSYEYYIYQQQILYISTIPEAILIK